MARQFYMSGPASVQFDAVDLGVNRGEIPINVQPFYGNVPTDEFAGDQGPPADAQFFGAIATVQVQLTKYELTNVEKVLRLVPVTSTSYAYGQFPLIGTFVKQQGMARVLQLTSANETRQFDYALIRNPYELNMSSRYRAYMMTFEIWMDAAATRQLWLMRNANDDATLPISGDPNHANYSNTALS